MVRTSLVLAFSCLVSASASARPDELDVARDGAVRRKTPTPSLTAASPTPPMAAPSAATGLSEATAANEELAAPTVPLDWIDAELAKGGAVASTDLSETTAANDQFAPTLPLVAPGRRLELLAVCFNFSDCGTPGTYCGSTDTVTVKNGGESARGICSVGTENRRRRTKFSPDHRKWGTGANPPALASMFKVDQGDGGCEVRLSDHQDDQDNDRTCHSFCHGHSRSCTRAHDVDKYKKNVRAAALLPPSCHANPTAHLAFPRPPPPRCATQKTATKRIANAKGKMITTTARTTTAASTQKEKIVTMRGAM